MAEWVLKFVCPITNELMVDPVTDPEGNSYERAAIEKRLAQNPISPITKAPLARDDLRDNPELRARIESHRQAQSTAISAASNSGDQSFNLSMTSSWADGLTHISIRPPDCVGVRAPCDICCVVDVSGSMSDAVEIQGASGKESTGLSQLDLVKHALKTIIHSLTENDRLSIVPFHSKASVLFELRPMDEQGRTTSIQAVETLRTMGSTNLWDGLSTGLDVLVKGQHASGSNAALFLLTDGVPSDHPKEGYLPALAAYKAKTNFTCSINTFGFGYSLESKLLEDLAQMGNTGSYAFIPDGSFVGTIFVNAISNLLTTAATNVTLIVGGVDPPVDPSSSYVCNYSTENFSDTRSFLQQLFASSGPSMQFNLGSVIFGQSRDVVIPMTEKQYNQLQLALDYQSAHGAKNKQCTSATKLAADLQSLNQQKHRLEFVYFIRQGYELLRTKTERSSENQQSVINSLQALEDAIGSHATDDKYLTDLLTDLTGQVKQAFSRMDWFTKWGIHYLPSITRAHLLQQCNNFKDPGVQHYGQGELFSAIRDEMDDIFCGLPAPVRVVSNATSSSSAPAPPIDMSMLNDSDNPCFHGSCTVKLFDGSIKLVKHIVPGDRLHPHGATVNYVLRTVLATKQALLALLDGGLMITPWHPIRVDGGRWLFPCSIVTSLTSVECEAVYSFALSEGHTMWINDVECVTLGHGFTEDIVRHGYYGSGRVLEDLRMLDGEQQCTGVVEIGSGWMMRNKRTGRVSGIRRPPSVVMSIGQ